MKMNELQRILNVFFIYVLCGVLLAGYAYQFIEQERPCPLCLLQRLGMIGICLGLLMNLRFGIKAKYYGFSLLSALLGQLISLRQISLHICLEFPLFGVPVLGLELYTWACIVFICSIYSISILLILSRDAASHPPPLRWSGLEITAFTCVAVMTATNVVTAFLECGIGACRE